MTQPRSNVHGRPKAEQYRWQVAVMVGRPLLNYRYDRQGVFFVQFTLNGALKIIVPVECITPLLSLSHFAVISGNPEAGACTNLCGGTSIGPTLRTTSTIMLYNVSGALIWGLRREHERHLIVSIPTDSWSLFRWTPWDLYQRLRIVTSTQ